MLHSISHHSSETSGLNPTVILLHGRGADEHDLFGLKEYFDPRVNIHSLRAPYEFEWGGYSWFQLREDGSVDEEGFAHSRNEILSFIGSIQTEQLFLLGFSMGAIMSYSIALTQPKLCSGIVAMSGFAPLQLEQEYRLNELQDLDIFISHGLSDPVIPVSSARRTKEMLAHSNARVSYNEYAMAHQINEECLNDMRLWMKNAMRF